MAKRFPALLPPQRRVTGNRALWGCCCSAPEARRDPRLGRQECRGRGGPVSSRGRYLLGRLSSGFLSPRYITPRCATQSRGSGSGSCWHFWPVLCKRSQRADGRAGLGRCCAAAGPRLCPKACQPCLPPRTSSRARARELSGARCLQEASAPSVSA